VLEAVHELWPQAPIYTSIHDPVALPTSWRTWDIRPSWMNRLPAVHSHSRLYLPLFAAAFETMCLRCYDVILSVSSAFAQGVRSDGATSICYCLTPPRFLWGLQDYVSREGLPGWQLSALRPLLALLRIWDRRAAARVSHFVAISHEVQRRIASIYGRDAPIIYPPVDTDRFQIRHDIGDYFLIVGRLVPYRRIDLAVQACNRLRLPLKVVGDGRARRQLEAIAGPTVQFLGHLPDPDTAALIERCRAFLWPGSEDFGIAPLEAQAAGRPVIAFANGGALETIIDGETGLLFHEQSVESLMQALDSFDESRFEPERLRQHALQFDRKRFQQRLRSYIEAVAHH